MSVKKFLAAVKRRLAASSLRYGGTPSRTIRRVAVCGGGGSDLLGRAITAGADAFVTADLSYHRFEEADGRILLVDAGHYETERPAIRPLVDFLAAECAKRARGIHVSASTSSRNPVQTYI
jgi:putative NIF3 family GTP cyclohydrolase 1 type 2